MALTKLTKGRARWQTFKLKVSKAVSRSLYDKILDQGISVKDFGATGKEEDDATLNIQLALSVSNHVIFPEGVYTIDPELLTTRGMVAREGSTLIFKNAVLKFKSKTYKDNVYMLGTSYGINFGDDPKRYKGLTIINLEVDGNASGVTLNSEKSSNALYLYKQDNVTLVNPKIKNMPLGNGGLPAIIFRFCNDFSITNPITSKDEGVLYATDRQSISVIESTGSISGGSLSTSRIREPIVVSTEEVQQYQKSVVSINGVTCDNRGTQWGSRIIRFSGNSDGTVNGCHMYADKANTGDGTKVAAFFVAVTSTQETGDYNHNISFTGNVIHAAGYGYEFRQSGKFIIKSNSNQFLDVDTGIYCTESLKGSSMTFSDYYKVSYQSALVSNVDYINLDGSTFIGGSKELRLEKNKRVVVDGVTITECTAPSYSLWVDAQQAGGVPATVSNTAIYNCTQNKALVGNDGMAISGGGNNFNTSGWWVMTQDGYWFYWINNGVMMLNGGVPTDRDNGTPVGVQEAPNDGKKYVRQNKKWVAVV